MDNRSEDVLHYWTTFRDSYNPVPGIMQGVPSSRNYEGGFTSKLMAKDLAFATASVAEVGLDCPLTADAHNILPSEVNIMKDNGSNILLKEVKQEFKATEKKKVASSSDNNPSGKRPFDDVGGLPPGKKKPRRKPILGGQSDGETENDINCASP